MNSHQPAVVWEQVSLDLGAFCLREVDLSVDPGTWLTLVGPTGAGKTLLLEVVAGFLEPTSGRVLRRGVDLDGVPPEAREVAYAPQDDLLFPHLSVRDNLLYGARDPEELDGLAQALGIDHLLDRRPPTLSGGEAQRVTLGRALLAAGDLLLLDEVTSALDVDTRKEVGEFLARWVRARGLTVVQVTHDPVEAERWSDRVQRIEDGRLV